MKILDAIRTWRVQPEEELDSILLSGFNPEEDAEFGALVQSMGFDRVLDVARREQVLPHYIVARMDPDATWRDIAQAHPTIADTLHRLAARIYGYRPILICEMGSLVLADLLASHFPRMDWKRLFDAGLVPVVEHGDHPHLATSIRLASHDPSRREVRATAESIPSLRPDIVYADHATVLDLQRDMTACIPAVRRAIGETRAQERPRLKKVVLPDDTGYGKAA
ncbi:MAG: hypothetical protein RIE53_06420 [Rhodothermales bacterium]